jgi:hypothetical protein
MAVDPRLDAACLKLTCQALDALGILANMREEDVDALLLYLLEPLAGARLHPRGQVLEKNAAES